ncbi:MAG: hypothetical protein ACRCXB_30165 [Aeromonadaceae bacterium]
MTTPKKKHLIELMIEAGVKWPDGAEYAAQDKDQEPGDHELDLINIVSFYRSKPEKKHVEPFWFGDSDIDDDVKLSSLCKNWHQTIVTREQYAEAVAATNGDGVTIPSQSNKVRESDDVPTVYAVELNTHQSIEQLAAYYHAKAAEAKRLQDVADEALKAADDAMLALEKAGELIGLVISIDTKPKQPAQPEITDWRDLRVGDVVECVRGENLDYEGKQGEVCEIDEEDSINRIRVKFNKNQSHWCSVWRFIRRQ